MDTALLQNKKRNQSINIYFYPPHMSYGEYKTYIYLHFVTHAHVLSGILKYLNLSKCFYSRTCAMGDIKIPLHL